MSETTARERFFGEHGTYVLREGEVIFEDGAICDASHGLGRLVEPPDDPYERAKIIALYHVTRAQNAKEEFLAYKKFLLGRGPHPDEPRTDAERREVLKLYMQRKGPHPDAVPQRSPEEKIERLDQLRQLAQTEARYAREARSRVDELEPQWLKRHRQPDLDLEQQSTFHQLVEDINC